MIREDAEIALKDVMKIIELINNKITNLKKNQYFLRYWFFFLLKHSYY
jgi:hypothetical protein